MIFLQSLLDWLSAVSWGQYDIFKFIILAVLIILVFDTILSLASRLFFGFVSGRSNK